MNYGSAVKGVVEDHIKNMDALDAQEKELQEQVRQERITGRVAAEKRKEIEDKRAVAITTAQQKIRELHQQHDEAVDRWDMPEGSKLTDDAKLLAVDFPMNEAQFQAFCDKYRNNSVMLRLLAQYADKHEGLYAFRPEDATVRKAEFADYCERAAGCIRNHNTLQAAMFLDQRYVNPAVTYEY